MRYSTLIPIAACLLALGACKDASGVTDNGPPPPAALVRFVNAVPDTGTVDLRFVDRVENLPTLQGVAFRASSGFYQRAEPGTRAARVFPNSTVPELAMIFLVDTTLALNADTRYTLVYAGRAAGNQDRLAVLADPPAAAPAAGQIAIKALHAAVGTGPVDVYVVPVGSATAATPEDWQTGHAGRIENVGYLAQSAYATFPVRPAGGFYHFVVTAAGTTEVVMATTVNLPGAAAPAGASYGPQPGVQIGGSALTLVVAPGAVPGTRQATAALSLPQSFLVVDRVLNP